MPTQNANVTYGITAKNNYQVGISDVDDGTVLENNIQIPVLGSSDRTWLYFECVVEVMLDSGIVVHNTLPQVDRTADTLASGYMNDMSFDDIDGGVNLKSGDQYKDIIQRMGHSRYWFRLRGRALRVGKKVPIPGIKTIGGVPAIPHDNNPQWAYNAIAPGGNFSGNILWKAAWSLWYTTAVPPVSQDIPLLDPAARTSTEAQKFGLIQAPFSQPDDNAVKFTPLGVVKTS